MKFGYEVKHHDMRAVLWAGNHMQALQRGAKIFECGTSELSVVRRRELDQFGKDEYVPWRYLVENLGWELPCEICGVTAGKGDPGMEWVGESSVVCSPECGQTFRTAIDSN